MNILRVADSAATLFAKKVHITLIDAESQSFISKHIVNSSSLPDSFNKPTILDIEDNKWQVVKVETISHGSYLRASRMLLHVVSLDRFKIGNNSLVPTLASITESETFEQNTLFKDYTLFITPDQWLQLEFLPIENTALIQEISSTIENIINTPDENNHLLGYNTIYIRNIAYNHQLKIIFEDFCTHINPIKKGNISMSHKSFIEKGFSLQSDNYNYYGIVDNGIICKLAIQTFDCVDEELAYLFAKYNLLFANWCSASIIAP